mgnify:CR=1 FL=1
MNPWSHHSTCDPAVRRDTHSSGCAPLSPTLAGVLAREAREELRPREPRPEAFPLLVPRGGLGWLTLLDFEFANMASVAYIGNEAGSCPEDRNCVSSICCMPQTQRYQLAGLGIHGTRSVHAPESLLSFHAEGPLDRKRGQRKS